MFNAFLVENSIFFVSDSCNTFFVVIDFFYVRSQFRTWANMSLYNFLYLIALKQCLPLTIPPPILSLPFTQTH